jgi:hypothetical protein
MASDIKLTSGEGSMQQRIEKRQRNSGVGKDVRPDFTVKQGNSPLRTFHNVHHGSTTHGASNNQGNPTEGKGKR